jgi:hypothetical protein
VRDEDVLSLRVLGVFAKKKIKGGLVAAGALVFGWLLAGNFCQGGFHDYCYWTIL